MSLFSFVQRSMMVLMSLSFVQGCVMVLMSLFSFVQRSMMVLLSLLCCIHSSIALDILLPQGFCMMLFSFANIFLGPFRGCSRCLFAGLHFFEVRFRALQLLFQSLGFSSNFFLCCDVCLCTLSRLSSSLTLYVLLLQHLGMMLSSFVC